MVIKVTCACEKTFQAPPELAGKRVNCPSCGQPIQIPQPGPSSIPVACQCGQRFAAKAALAGKQVTCPACQSPLTIPSAAPSSAATLDPLVQGNADADPLGLGSSPDDPLGLTDSSNDPLGGIPAAADQVPGAYAVPAATGQSYQQAPRVKKKQYDVQRVIEIVTGVLAIYHGGSAIVRTAMVFPIFAKLATLVGIQAFFSFAGILFLIGLAIGAGILAGGIGLLMDQEWGLQVGVIASYGYFFLLAIGLVIGMFGVAYMTVTGVMLMVIRVAADSLAPGLMIFLHSQKTS